MSPYPSHPISLFLPLSFLQSNILEVTSLSLVVASPLLYPSIVQFFFSLAGSLVPSISLCISNWPLFCYPAPSLFSISFLSSVFKVSCFACLLHFKWFTPPSCYPTLTFLLFQSLPFFSLHVVLLFVHPSPSATKY